MSENKLPDWSKLYSLEAEAGVLGSMILEPLCIGKVLPKLPRAESFFLPEHRLIYETILRLYINNQPIDGISVRTELKEQGKLEMVGGVEYIRKIMDTVCSAANAVYYAGVVRAKEKERQVRAAVEQIAKIPDEPGSVDEMIQRIQATALELEPTGAGPDFVEMKEVVTAVATDMRGGMGEALPTGFADLDRMLHGFYPGEFVIVAGRPSMGKSALAMAMALNMGKAGAPVFFSSLEMTTRSLVERAVCSLACVDMTRLRSEQADENEWSEIYGQALELRNYEIILSTIAGTPEQFAALIHRLKQTHGIQIAFVDYLQLMTTSGRVENRQQEITEISRKLKAIALRENIPVIALSQLNRQVDAREDHRPRMSDLRESGSLEQDADLVLFVYREDYYEKDKPGFEPTGIAEVIVSKNRRGPTGTEKLVFVHDYVKFSNLTHFGAAT